MPNHQISPTLPFRVVDKRRAGVHSEPSYVGQVRFTANDAGTTTTIVGADATLASGANVVRTGERFKVFNSSGVLKQEKVVRVTDVASAAGVTTVTFTPALTGATASGDTLREVAPVAYNSIADMDARLNAFNSTLYSQARLDAMSVNDKQFAIRQLDDAGSL